MLISSAGDIELADRLYRFLLSSSMSSRASISIENDEITVVNEQSRADTKHLRRILEGFLSSNDDLDDYSLTNIGELFTIGILRRMHDLDCTNYLEKVIERRVGHLARFLKGKRPTAAVARGYKAAIRILRTAPRDEYEIRNMIESRKRLLQDTTTISSEDPIHDEIEALDWLLTVVRLQSEEHCEVEIV